jgi:phage repressor protein C with HTH and peptisase S24 domain
MQKKKRYAIGGRILLRRQELGISQVELANAVEMKQQGIQSIESGVVKRPGKLRELAAALRTSQEYLLDGKGPKDLGSHIERSDAIDEERRPTSGILEIDVRAGLGGGGTTEGREVRHDGDHADPVKSESWHFPARFMREELRAPESRVIILETEGDSMAPTILSGDRVVIDTGHRVPSPDGIYALRDRYGNIVVKRLQTLQRGETPLIRIISDNKSHDPEDVSIDEISIVGRALWGMKRL